MVYNKELLATSTAISDEAYFNNALVKN